MKFRSLELEKIILGILNNPKELNNIKSYLSKYTKQLIKNIILDVNDFIILINMESKDYQAQLLKFFFWDQNDFDKNFAKKIFKDSKFIRDDLIRVLNSLSMHATTRIKQTFVQQIETVFGKLLSKEEFNKINTLRVSDAISNTSDARIIFNPNLSNNPNSLKRPANFVKENLNVKKRCLNSEGLMESMLESVFFDNFYPDLNDFYFDSDILDLKTTEIVREEQQYPKIISEIQSPINTQLPIISKKAGAIIQPVDYSKHQDTISTLDDIQNLKENNILDSIIAPEIAKNPYGLFYIPQVSYDADIEFNFEDLPHPLLFSD